jgi:hypothetical protein
LREENEGFRIDGSSVRRDSSTAAAALRSYKKKKKDNTPFLKIADKSDNKKLHGYSFAERSAGKEAVGQLIIIDLGSYFLMSLMHTVSSLL